MFNKALRSYRMIGPVAALLLASLLVGSHLFGAGVEAVASRELGQVNFAHNSINYPTASRFFGPSAVALDRSVTPNRLYIAEYQNNRVVAYSDVSKLANGR